MLKALLGRLFEAAAHDAQQRRGHREARVELPGLRVEDRVPALDGRLTGERELRREALVENGAEREEIAARVGDAAAHLLGRHVPGGAHDRARLRQRQRAGGRRRALGGAGHAEVEDLHLPVARDEQVVGLEISVNDALLVHRGEAVGDLRRELDDAAGG